MTSHPEKLLFPSDGISKGEIAAYYEAVAKVMLPHLRGRPVTMERFPAGIEAKGFMQKNVVKGFPEWLARVEVPKKDGVVHYPLADDERSLLWMANQNCITLHVWSARVPQLTQPDLCVFDLDPSQDDASALRAGALAVRELLAELGLRTWLKTSGSKGFHIVAPLDGVASYDVVWQFTHRVGAVLVKRHPASLTQEFIKADRKGRMLIDTGRNGYGATFAAAYSVRPKPGAPVSAPCTWDELEQGLVNPQTFHVKNMAERLANKGDLWAQLYMQPHSLAQPIERLQQLLSAQEWDQALAASTRRPRTRREKPGS